MRVIRVQKVPSQRNYQVNERLPLASRKDEEEDARLSLSPWRRDPFRRCRNLFDLVLECESEYERYNGDWLWNEYILNHDNDYLVSFIIEREMCILVASLEKHGHEFIIFFVRKMLN